MKSKTKFMPDLVYAAYLKMSVEQLQDLFPMNPPLRKTFDLVPVIAGEYRGSPIVEWREREKWVHFSNAPRLSSWILGAKERLKWYEEIAVSLTHKS